MSDTSLKLPPGGSGTVVEVESVFPPWGRKG